MKAILQSEASECGLTCLAMIACHFGYDATINDLRRKLTSSQRGVTLSQLIRSASVLNFASRPLRLELDELVKLRLPCILHWDMTHFVVLNRVRKKWGGDLSFEIMDPAVGKRLMALSEIGHHFTGIALELIPTEQFELRTEAPRLRLRQLVGKIRGLRPAVFQIIAIAITLEIFAIAFPLFNQFVIDEVLVANDRNLLTILTLGFGLMLIVQTMLSVARSWFLMNWNFELSFQWGSRIFNHLLKLPVSYFEKRNVGDVISRFGSLGVIQSTLTNFLIESLLDGLMALLALGIMFAYSPLLSSIVIVCSVFYVTLRLAFYGPLKNASRERLIFSAKESTNFIETIRAIVPLKLFGREADRLANWQNLRVDVINRDLATQKLELLFRVGSSTIQGFQVLILLYMGATLVIDSTITIGMLVAFLSYAATFTTRVSNLVNVAVSVKMLSLHLERLSDIVGEEPEIESHQNSAAMVEPVITLENVSFRYSDGEPWILQDVSLTLVPRQVVALVGPSGCGKTTLCKLLLGILKPTVGEVRINGVPIEQYGLRAYRDLVGSVMQDDILLTGSIGDNISFFDSKPDLELIKKCAMNASIHGEISSMPMQYNTLVGEMGSSLSGGQRQRILLARALYKKPYVLALDEAT
eukprot:gene13467-28535_t